MQEIVGALRDQQGELAEYVDGVGEADLLRPSRCPGWTVADVLLHLAQTNEMAIASVQGRLGAFVDEAVVGLQPVGSIDEWAGALVDLQRGSPVESRDRWIASTEVQADVFESVDPATRLTWVAGDLAARSLASTRLTETWIHTVDVAVAFDAPPAPTDRLWHVARLAWRTIPYAFAQAGIEASGSIAFELVAPNGSSWDFGTDDPPATVISGSALDLCTVAGQRANAAATDLIGVGPDAEAVLRLVRTFA